MTNVCKAAVNKYDWNRFTFKWIIPALFLLPVLKVCNTGKDLIINFLKIFRDTSDLSNFVLQSALNKYKTQ